MTRLAVGSRDVKGLVSVIMSSAELSPERGYRLPTSARARTGMGCSVYLFPATVLRITIAQTDSAVTPRVVRATVCILSIKGVSALAVSLGTEPAADAVRGSNGVLASCQDFHVRRVHTKSDPAFVMQMAARWDRRNQQFVDSSMRQPHCIAVSADTAVAINTADSTAPQPTGWRHLNLAEQPIRKRHTLRAPVKHGLVRSGITRLSPPAVVCDAQFTSQNGTATIRHRTGEQVGIH